MATLRPMIRFAAMWGSKILTLSHPRSKTKNKKEELRSTIPFKGAQKSCHEISLLGFYHLPIAPGYELNFKYICWGGGNLVDRNCSICPSSTLA